MSVVQLANQRYLLEREVGQPHFIDLDTEVCVFTLEKLIHRSAQFDYTTGTLMLLFTPREGVFGTFELTVYLSDDEESFYELKNHSLLESAWKLSTVGELTPIAQAVLEEMNLHHLKLNTTVEVAIPVPMIE